MASRRNRLIALLLAADLFALVGCGTVPSVPQTGAIARGAVKPGVAQVIAKEAPQQTSVRPGAAVARPASAAPAALAPIALSEPLPPPAELFQADYSEARFKATNPEAEDAETARAVRAEMSMPSGSIGKIGGAIGAGLLGSSLLGYFVYAGMVGSRDLMFPAKTTFKKDPGAYGVDYEQVVFPSHDGLKLVGWYVPAAVKTDKGLVLFHGHSSNKDTMYRKYGAWLHEKYNLFLYDSRYHGESEGKFTTLGYFERKDAMLALAQLRSHGNASIGVMGESMGGAVAIDVAAADKGVKAVLSDCAFDTLQDAIAPRAEKRKYPMPSAVGFAVRKTVEVRARALVEQADPIKFVAQIAPRPLLLIHGQKDDDTTPINSEKLFEKAQQPKEIWRTPDADHAESVEKYPDEYKRRALEFFDKAL